jgi:hypothetical protein
VILLKGDRCFSDSGYNKGDRNFSGLDYSRDSSAYDELEKNKMVYYDD